MNTEQCNLLQTRIYLQLREFNGRFSQLFPQNLLKTDPAGRLGQPLYGSVGLKRLTNIENGCMRFIPGSHQRGLAEHRSGRPLSAASGGTAAAVQEIQVEESEAAAVPARPGHGSLHHCLTHHGTPSNRTPHRRRAIICHYMPLDFQYMGPEEERPPFYVVRGSRSGEVV